MLNFPRFSPVLGKLRIPSRKCDLQGTSTVHSNNIHGVRGYEFLPFKIATSESIGGKPDKIASDLGVMHDLGDI